MTSYHAREPGVVEKATYGFRELGSPTLRRLAALATRYTWSPGAFEGGHRKRANFRYSDFVAFDVDNKPGEEPYPLAQAVRDWADSHCVIGTTRNHQREKDGYPPADRFRIITQWEQRITDLDTYEYNLGRVLKVNSAFDASCSDGARLFYPCKEIVYAQFDGIKQPVVPLPEKREQPWSPEKSYAQMVASRRFGHPPHIAAFLEKGTVFGAGRNQSVYVTALYLLDAGVEPSDIVKQIEASPFKRGGFTSDETQRTVESATNAFIGRIIKAQR